MSRSIRYRWSGSAITSGAVRRRRCATSALGLKKYPGLIERLKEREQQVEKREAVVGKETDTKAALELATVKAERDTYRRLYEDLIRGFIPTAPAGA